MDQLPAADLPDGGVRRAGPWTVSRRGDELRAVSSRCRHQFADLSNGSLDADGCLVCPWHGSRYDLDTGAMTRGPRGFLSYRGATPGYSQLVLAVGRVLRLRRARVVRDGGTLRIGRVG